MGHYFTLGGLIVSDKIFDKDKPFLVCHTNGDVVKGFDDLASAEADAKERNNRALNLGIRSRYIAGKKPA